MDDYRFALQLTSAASGAEWVAAGQAAEADGWDVVSIPDHLNEQFAPFVALGALSCVTERVRLGTFVVAAPWRHVGMLAKEVATLDVLSDGRVELGLGGGWHAVEFAALGQAFERASTRIAVVAETVAALRALWRGDTVDLPGPYFSGTGLQCLPLPVQAGGPPIVLGGGGPRMLALAGQVADVVSLIPSNAGRTVWWSLPDGIDRAAVAQQVAWVKEAAAGRATQPVLNIRILAVTPGRDPLGAARSLAGERGAGTADALVDSPYLLLGRPQDMAEQMARNREELGVAYYTVSAREGAEVMPAIELVR